MKYFAVFILLQFLFIYNGYLQAQWVQTSGLNGRAVYCLAVSGPNIFAGSNGSGVFLSSNNGINWTQVTDGLTDNYVNVLIVNGINIFAATHLAGVWRRPLSELVSVSKEVKKYPRVILFSRTTPIL